MSSNSYITNSYLKTFGEGPKSLVTLAGAGSDRRYYRIFPASGPSIIGCLGNNPAENRAFTSLTEAFALPFLPKLISVADERTYFQEDLGDTSLCDLILKEGERECAPIVRQALEQLAVMQLIPVEKWEKCTMAAPFCRRQIFWDLNYFKYEYLKPAAVPFDEEALEDDFERLAGRLLEIPKEYWGFMFRDFQSRNVMVLDSKPYFIDYQGGRMGSSLYDAVSFLWQARVNFSPEYRLEMLNFYASKYCQLRPECKPKTLLSPLNVIVLFRTLQVLGAYGFRGLVEHKAKFIESIPEALANLQALDLSEFPEIQRISTLLNQDTRFKRLPAGKLHVEVYSFSYKKGYPEDYSGNGGGFMFDCRAMHNPGRYQEYKHLTGKDQEVIDFLEERGEVQPFLRNAFGLIDPAVERYLQRGFSKLQIGFGCTGGQHRSVYCAEHAAAHLRERFPEAEVILHHREQE